MNRSATGLVLGMSSLVLWFTPLVNVDATGYLSKIKNLYPEGVALYQSGQHIGGISYLLLLAGAGYAIFSWRRQRIPSIVFAGLGLTVSFIFAVEAGSSMAWGLVSLLGLFGASLLLALITQSPQTPPAP